jgi:hypothetical protein
MESMERYTRIETTCKFEDEAPHDDFIEHFYLTRYDRLRGLLMTSPEELRIAVKKAIYDSIGKNQYELPLLQDEGKAGLAWSMNWYRLCDSEHKAYQLTQEDQSKILADFVELGKASPLKIKIYIFQLDTSDTCLIAVSHIL